MKDCKNWSKLNFADMYINDIFVCTITEIKITEIKIESYDYSNDIMLFQPLEFYFSIPNKYISNLMSLIKFNDDDLCIILVYKSCNTKLSHIVNIRKILYTNSNCNFVISCNECDAT